MMDLRNENKDNRVARLVSAVDQLKESGDFEFVTNEDPNDMLQEVWQARTGLFQCSLLEQTENLWRIKVAPKKGCCGHCC